MSAKHNMICMMASFINQECLEEATDFVRTTPLVNHYQSSRWKVFTYKVNVLEPFAPDCCL
jgi:hypothetical protein